MPLQYLKALTPPYNAKPVSPTQRTEGLSLSIVDFVENGAGLVRQVLRNKTGRGRRWQLGARRFHIIGDSNCAALGRRRNVL